MKMRSLLTVLLVGLLVLGLSSQVAAWERYDRDPDPDELTFAIIATEEIALHIDRYQGLLDWVSEITGKPTGWYVTTSYASVIEAMRTGTVDFAGFGPTSAVLAMEQAGAEVFAIRVDNDTGEQGYFTYVTALAGSGIETFPDDLEGKIVGFTDPASTSGHVAVRAFLDDQGIDPAEFFEDIIWTGSHQAGQLSVAEGRVDAAAVASTVYWRTVDRGEIDPDEVVIIWQSELIPLGPAAYRTDLSPELKEQIREAYLTFHETEHAVQWLEEMNTSGFQPASNADFDIIAAMQRVLED